MLRDALADDVMTSQKACYRLCFGRSMRNDGRARYVTVAVRGVLYVSTSVPPYGVRKYVRTEVRGTGLSDAAEQPTSQQSNAGEDRILLYPRTYVCTPRTSGPVDLLPRVTRAASRRLQRATEPILGPWRRVKSSYCKHPWGRFSGTSSTPGPVLVRSTCSSTSIPGIRYVSMVRKCTEYIPTYRSMTAYIIPGLDASSHRREALSSPARSLTGP